ncbi:MAG: N-acetyltransferase family protein [Halobacteriota archaeon]
MNRTRTYPETMAGSFDSPPIDFTDHADRNIRIRVFDPDGDDRALLVEMYCRFDPADRAQGIPPSNEDRIRTWLDTILAEGCLNVLAWHDDEVIGHATLVPDGEAYELAIFVLQAYQRAGIGTQLIEALLGYGVESGVEKVWLTVERWNQAAVSLYEQMGFEVSDAESFELEMALRLA